MKDANGGIPAAFWVAALIALSGNLYFTGHARAEDSDEHTQPATIPTIPVDCDDANHTITKALRSAHGSPITILVSGTCRENLAITVSSVALVTTTGAMIIGPDPTKPTILITADGTTIDGFTITGGVGGITTSGSQRTRILHCTIENEPTRAISLGQLSQAVVDHCTLNNNQFGLSAGLGSTFTITNSTINNNTFTGLEVNFGSSAYVGADIFGNFGGNVISGNGASGIQIAGHAFAVVANNTISHNGTNFNPAFGLAGVGVYESAVSIPGNNIITDNGVYGIQIRASSALIGGGDVLPHINTLNTIARNGTGANAPSQGGGAGIFVELDSGVALENAVVTNNTGPGLLVQLQSSVEMFNTTFTQNSTDGIRLVLGGGVLLKDPRNSASGNTGFGLNCIGAKSSVAGDTSGFGAAPGSNISPACTGF